jgi:hypothetical protein
MIKYSEFTKSKGVETLAMIAFGFLVFGGIIWFKNGEYPMWPIYVALCSLFFGLFVPIISKQVTWLWFKLAQGMGFVMSKVVLGALFYSFIVPYSFLYRLFNSDNLNIKKKKQTYYSDRDMEYSHKDLENPW